MPFLKHANAKNEMKIPKDANALKQTKKNHDTSDGQSITILATKINTILKLILYCKYIDILKKY